MTTKRLTLIAATAGTLMLAACGGGGSGGNASSDGGSSATVLGGMPSSWKATDACSILDKAAVGAALGTEVTETSVSMVHEAAANEVATSECLYLLKDGGRATLMTRWSPISDNTPEVIKTARSAVEQSLGAFGSSKKLEDVPGLGKAAFWVPGINQLSVFIGADRMIVLTVGSAPEATAKDIAVGLAKKAGA